jgi:HlyD family secretion protein
MSSKAIKPKILIGQNAGSERRRQILLGVGLAVLAGGAFWGYQKLTEADVDVAADKVRRAEFVVSIQTRGEIKSVRSSILTVPQVPDLQITNLVTPGTPVKAGTVVIEFDRAQQEQNLLERNTAIRAVDSEGKQTQAGHRITNEMDSMNTMTAKYNVERADLEVGKAEILSQIEGEKSKIDLGIANGELKQTQTTADSHVVAQKADLLRLKQKRDKSVRDLQRTNGYLSTMVMRAPSDGIAIVLPNFRSEGFGSSTPPFKVGDKVWTGASVIEIPDLTEMRIDLELEEEDRGKVQLGQQIRLKIDAVPDKELIAELDWISPMASLRFRGWPPQKYFPARATLKTLDDRLRPGMSASAEIVLESLPKALMIPQKATFLRDGKPIAYVQKGKEFVPQPIRTGKRNGNDIVIESGLRENDVVALEDPAEALKRARKL